MPAACSRSQCLEIEKLGFKPARVLGEDAEKVDEGGLRGQSPIGSQPTGTGEGQEQPRGRVYSARSCFSSGEVPRN